MKRRVFGFLALALGIVLAACSGGTDYVGVSESSTTPAVVENYTVTFSTNGGSDVAAQTVESGKPATEPPAPTKDGFTFGGWYADSALTSALSFSTAITSNITLYAKWISATVPTFEVTFEANGGSAVTKQVVASGEKASEPTSPTKTGATFAGWYADSGLTGTFDFNTAITSNTTLYAKWTCAVTFDSNGGSAVASQSIAEGGTATEPAEPTKTGATFGGWCADSELTSAFDFTTAITSSTTIYAKWTYSVTVDGAITGGTVGSDKTTGISSGSTVTLTVTAGFEKVMDTITVKDASNNAVTTTAVVAGTSYTFTMPESNVTVTATFADPYSTGLVGDIVLSDGKYITATNYEKYSEQLTQTAVAVIFDVSGSNKKGVGLVQGAGAWARYTSSSDKADGYSNSIAGLVCTPSASGSGKAGDTTVTFTGTTDGSTSLTTLKAAVSDYSATNYPAWDFVENYATTANLTGTSYASGWYMPSIAELCKLYQAKTDVNNALSKITDATRLFTSSVYWSSSQTVFGFAWYVQTAFGILMFGDKKGTGSVYAVRAF